MQTFLSADPCLALAKVGRRLGSPQVCNISVARHLFGQASNAPNAFLVPPTRQAKAPRSRWYSETGEWYSETGGGIRKLRFGNWRWYSETGKWYSETGKWYSETGEWYSETGNGFPKLVFRNWKHCIRKLASGIPKLEGSIRKLGVVFGNSFSDTRILDLGHEGEAQILLNVFARGGGGF